VSTLLVGPTVTVRRAAGLTPAIRRWDEEFTRLADQHWEAEGAEWSTGNYYDRALIYYAQWVRSANPEYWRRANLMALDYRRRYLEANNYGSSAHWSMLDGVALHYLVSGDEASRVAVGRVGDTMAAAFYVNNLSNLAAEMDNRIQARVLLAFVLSNQLRAPSRDGHDWAVRARAALTKIVASQGGDGGYHFTHPNGEQCGHTQPFMVGLLNDALIRYDALFEADPRIQPTIRKSLDYLWANAWDPAGRSFVYLDGPCPAGARYTRKGSPDLNNLILTGYAWYAQQSGNDVYQRRADQIFEGAVGGSWLSGSKQFNQQYTSSYRYLGYRTLR
jgi:hypothetical protein